MRSVVRDWIVYSRVHLDDLNPDLLNVCVSKTHADLIKHSKNVWMLSTQGCCTIIKPNLYWTQIIPFKGIYHRPLKELAHCFFSLCFPQLLSRKDKATFERLEYLMSKEDNYKRLRDYISSQSMTSCIPYLGIFSFLSYLHTHKT